MPSRLLWFVIGSATTVWVMKRSRANAQYTYTYTDDEGKQHTVTGSGQWGPSWKFNHPPGPNTVDIRVGTHESSTPPTPVDWRPSSMKDWDEERKREEWRQNTKKLTELSDQAVDAMGDMAEPTVEFVLSTLQTLKAKLAEHRAQRDADLRQQAEKQDRNGRPGSPA